VQAQEMAQVSVSVSVLAPEQAPVMGCPKTVVLMSRRHRLRML
jgi:hypothetical protein